MGHVVTRQPIRLINDVNTALPPFNNTSLFLVDPPLPPGDEHYWKLVDDALVEMDQAEKDAVDATALVGAKASKLKEIDARTNQLIALGFSYQGKTFSLSVTSQSKMTGAYGLRDDPAFSYPVRWNTLDDTDYVDLANAGDLHAFYLMATGVMRGHLDSGTALKDSIRSATSLAELDAVVDSR